MSSREGQVMKEARPKWEHYTFEMLLSVSSVFIATGVGYLFRTAGFPETNIVLLYLLSVLITARFTDDFAFGLITSVLATVAFNYFFTAPYYSFHVDDPSYLITFAIMTFTSVITSTLTSRVKKSVEEQIRYREESRQEHYRGNLLRAISHDLRTPLSGIMGTSEMIRDMSAIDDPRHKLADEIWKDADWLHAIVENILNLTRLEDGRLALQKEPEAVEEIIGSALEHIESRAPGYEINVSIPDELLMVPMDAKLIVQALVNLLDNAVKHTQPGGPISVSVEKNERFAVFHVTDSGEGISEDDLPNIFKMFYTSPNNATNARRGVGLGLPICNTIVKAHGGTITACNRPGGGAQFTFTLPLEVENHE